jgi:hypothetical protein
MIGTLRRSWDSDHLRTAPERCLPVSIAVCLLFVGLENLLVLWLGSAWLLTGDDLPGLWRLAEFWGSPRQGAIPRALAAVHCVMVVYLWVMSRASRPLRRSAAPLGTALLIAAQHYWLLNVVLPVPVYRVLRLW